MKNKTNIFDTKIKISTVIKIIIAVAILWYFIDAKASSNRYESYQNQLDLIDSNLERVATDEYSYIITGTYTTQQAMQEVYDLEKEFEKLKREIRRDSFDGTYELILDSHTGRVEFQFLFEKYAILKFHKVGESYEGSEYRAYLDWSRGLSEYQRKQEFEKIRLGK